MMISSVAIQNKKNPIFVVMRLTNPDINPDLHTGFIFVAILQFRLIFKAFKMISIIHLID